MKTVSKIAALGAVVFLLVRRTPWFDATRAAARASGFPNDLMAIVVSVAVLGASLYVILTKKFSPESDKWAYGAVGTITGFWLA